MKRAQPVCELVVAGDRPPVAVELRGCVLFKRLPHLRHAVGLQPVAEIGRNHEIRLQVPPAVARSQLVRRRRRPVPVDRQEDQIVIRQQGDGTEDRLQRAVDGGAQFLQFAAGMIR